MRDWRDGMWDMVNDHWRINGDPPAIDDAIPVQEMAEILIRRGWRCVNGYVVVIVPSIWLSSRGSIYKARVENLLVRHIQCHQRGFSRLMWGTP